VESEGSPLARRTEIAYEACKLDEKANVFKVRYLYGKLVRICGGHKREGGCALPGEVCNFAEEQLALRGGGKKLQKSAEGIVVPFDRSEGPNLK